VDDIVIAGAGPAGSLAAAILARAGLRVRVFERSRFPRHKLCGDTLNPGALSVLRRHFDVAALIASSEPIDGMMLTGPGGVHVRGEYGDGVAGRAITREVLDQWLLDRATGAGAVIEQEVVIRDAAIADGRVAGVIADGRSGKALTHRARMVIAADGRRSAIAIGRGLSRQPARPRRWAIGAYFSDVSGMTSLGEMHVRRGHYIGVAPVPGGLINACLVVPHPASRRPFGETNEAATWPMSQPAAALNQALRDDPELAPRFAHARAASPAVMLGPMAVDTTAVGESGLLLAGDAAGFIDPMTGDGLRFALLGAEIAAGVAKEFLDGTLSIDRAHLELAERRRRAFQSKWRFNRALRSLVSSPSSVTAAAATAKVLPSVFSKIINYAGDCR
jgi:flavin-dependent dehydrogenase